MIFEVTSDTFWCSKIHGKLLLGKYFELYWHSFYSSIHHKGALALALASILHKSHIAPHFFTKIYLPLQNLPTAILVDGPQKPTKLICVKARNASFSKYKISTKISHSITKIFFKKWQANNFVASKKWRVEPGLLPFFSSMV